MNKLSKKHIQEKKIVFLSLTLFCLFQAFISNWHENDAKASLFLLWFRCLFITALSSRQKDLIALFEIERV